MGQNAYFRILLLAWKKRHGKPLEVAKAISEVIANRNMSPHRIALRLGAKAAEVAAFQDLACLSAKAQRYFERYKLPVTLAVGLLDEEEEVQENVLSRLCKSNAKPSKVIDEFEYLLYKSKYERREWRYILTGEQLKHISSKAKSYDVLSARQRKALFDMGRRLCNGQKLTVKQRQYLDSILGTCQHQGILNRSCSVDQCDVCNAITDLIERKPNGAFTRGKRRSSSQSK